MTNINKEITDSRLGPGPRCHILMNWTKHCNILTSGWRTSSKCKLPHSHSVVAAWLVITADCLDKWWHGPWVDWHALAWSTSRVLCHLGSNTACKLPSGLWLAGKPTAMWELLINITSCLMEWQWRTIKPEVHNESQRCQRKTEPWPEATGTKI